MADSKIASKKPCYLRVNDNGQLWVYKAEQPHKRKRFSCSLLTCVCSRVLKNLVFVYFLCFVTRYLSISGFVHCKVLHIDKGCLSMVCALTFEVFLYNQITIVTGLFILQNKAVVIFFLKFFPFSKS